MIDSKKLVKKLENAIEWTALEYYQECHSAARLIRELEAKNAALKARVAELENEKAEVSEYAEELAAMVGDLQSQLAWTPVSAGLPTEPGWYVFVGKLSTVYQFDGSYWPLPVEFLVEQDHTHYRRIELPKDGET